MNIKEFEFQSNKKLAFCIIDRTFDSATGYIKEIVKNQADYTISNIASRWYNTFQGTNEDLLLNHVANKGYEFVVVIKTGTEFIDGDKFFKEVEKLTKTDIALAGHILDRKEAYYELHDQCYYLNLKIYNEYGRPLIGSEQLNHSHYQSIPIRSEDNIHDNYTPWSVQPGGEYMFYSHKLHGWNIISHYLKNKLKIEVFNEDIRTSKIHLYPEYVNEFNKNSKFLFQRHNYCSNNFVHKSSTDKIIQCDIKFDQLVIPASGFQYEHLLSSDATIIFYDYNQSALNYWKENTPPINARFEYIDLLGEMSDITSLLDRSKTTLINLSNIFCYEGTAVFADLRYRLYKENLIIENIQKYMPEAWVFFSDRAWLGFKSLTNEEYFNQAKNLELTDIFKLECPTWHNSDWI